MLKIILNSIKMKKLAFAVATMIAISMSLASCCDKCKKGAEEATDSTAVDSVQLYKIVDGANMSISVVNAADTLGGDTVTFLKDDSTEVTGSILIGNIVKLTFREDGKTLALIENADSIE